MSGSPGVKDATLTSDSTPVEIFDRFFTAEIWSLMVEETNRYAAQNPPNPSGHMKAWKDTDETELRKYIGLRIYMGLVVRPSFRHYWSDDSDGDSLVKRIMTRDRFDALKAHLHFSDNTSDKAKSDRYVFIMILSLFCEYIYADTRFHFPFNFKFNFIL